MIFESTALFLSFAGGCGSALANLSMRRSIDVGGGASGYLLTQLFVSGLIATLMNPVQNQAYGLDLATALLGITAGICLALVMIFLGRSFSQGPAGLSIAFINSSMLMPALLLSLIFGPTRGFIFDEQHWIGSALIVIALFWASATTLKIKAWKNWLLSISIAFFSHILLLSLFQYRSLLLRAEITLDPPLIPTHITYDNSHWFLPIMFAIAWLVQLLLFFNQGNRKLRQAEIGYGILGGVANGLGAMLIIAGANAAKGIEATLLFPLNAVSVVVITSLWSMWLYKESVNWPAIALAIVGILCGAF